MNLKQQRAAALKAAQDLIATVKAAGREFTATEAQRLKAYRDEITDLDERIKAADAAAGIVAGFGTAGNAVDGSVKNARLDLSGLTDAMVSGMKAYSGQVQPGAKGLVPSGETIVTIPLVNRDPIPGAGGLETPPRLIDVLPITRRDAPHYEFLRQVVVADAGGAGVVAPGAVKPSLKLGVERVPSRLRVIAVLSEPQDRYMLEDTGNLRTWVAAELGDAIQATLETQVLAGNGTGENFTGLANTSGIQVQGFQSDPLITVQYGLSKLQNLGIAPAFVAMSAQAWLTIQTTRRNDGGFDVSGPVDATAQRAWGVPVVVVPGLADSDGYVVGVNTVEISVDSAGGLRTEWGTPGDQFARNQLTARCEGRFNLDVLRPHGVVRLTLEDDEG